MRSRLRTQEGQLIASIFEDILPQVDDAVAASEASPEPLPLARRIAERLVTHYPELDFDRVVQIIEEVTR